MGSYALVRTGDAELAESIVARVFGIVVRKFHQCRGNQAAWLWSIVRSELARHFREQRSHVPIDQDLADQLPDAHPTPVEQLIQRETIHVLRHALVQLNDDEQTIIFLKFFQDMPNVDIAEATEITPSNVGVKVHRALKRLRDVMADYVESDRAECAGPLDGS